MGVKMSQVEINDSDLDLVREKFQTKQNADGLIKSTDIEHILRACGVVIQKVVLNERMKEAEGSFIEGLCDFECFVKIYKRCFAEQPDEEVLINAIKSLAPIGSDTVPAELMRDVLMNFGDKLSAEEADEFIADCDEFGTGEFDAELVSQVLIHGPK